MTHYPGFIFAVTIIRFHFASINSMDVRNVSFKGIPIRDYAFGLTLCVTDFYECAIKFAENRFPLATRAEFNNLFRYS